MSDTNSSNTATVNYSWTLTAFQNQGNLWLRWNSNAPFRAQQSKIEVYSDGWPSNPDSNAKAWTWGTNNNGEWDSGLRWGSGWYCALIAQVGALNKEYVYVIRFVTEATEEDEV